jgi:predicted RNA-binding Zn ribbon-like protein
MNAPHWAEIGADAQLEERAQVSAVEWLLAKYARSAKSPPKARPSSGFARGRRAGCRPRRRQQSWCSKPCGNRTRFTRHYARQAFA